MKFRKFISAAFAALMSASLIACGSSTAEPATPADAEAPAETEAAAPAAEAAASADSINIELTTAPVGLHPLKTNDAPSTYVNGQIFETLYRRTNDGTAYDPQLAAELPEFSEDGLTATTGISWSLKKSCSTLARRSSPASTTTRLPFFR